MSLYDSITTRYLPSIVGSSSLYLALYLGGNEDYLVPQRFHSFLTHFQHLLERIQPESMCTMQDPCVQELFTFFREYSMHYQSLYSKYAPFLPCEIPPLSPECSPL